MGFLATNLAGRFDPDGVKPRRGATEREGGQERWFLTAKRVLIIELPGQLEHSRGGRSGSNGRRIGCRGAENVSQERRPCRGLVETQGRCRRAKGCVEMPASTSELRWAAL